MTNVLILGANGQLARNTTKFFLDRTDARLTLYLRRASRLRNPDPARVAMVEGDVLDSKALTEAMQGQDVVYASLAGAMAQQARTIVDAMQATGLKRLIFISSMGIYGEVPGENYRSVLDPWALVYGIVRSASAGWGALTVATITIGLMLLALFVIIERRAKQPIMPLRLFANSARNGAYAARVLFLGGMMGFWFFTTQLLQGVIGYSPFEAGVAFLPTTLANFAMAMAVPGLTRRLGNARLLAIGMTIALIGMASLSWVSVNSPSAIGVMLPMVLIGIGQGCSLSPLTIAGIAGVAAEDAGAASGLVNVAHQLGGSLGLGVLTVIFATASSGALNARELLAHRIATSFAGSTVMLALALALVIVLIVQPLGRRSEQYQT